jgi:hypothetical protein
MIDSSSSMADLVAAGKSKWRAVVSALEAFTNDPASAGLGVALQYFPLTSAGLPATCTASSQCGAAGPCMLSICDVSSSSVFPCDTSADCPRRAACMRVGQCQNDSNVLCTPGTDCGADPSGFPLGPCMPMTSSTCLAGDSCAVQDYATPAVAFASLPGSTGAVAASLAAHQPQGNTPTAAALAGVIQGAQAYGAAHPSHTVAAILATDGIPDECTPSDIPGIAALAAAGVAGSPAVKTFAIGVFAPSDVASGTQALNLIASRGGTGTAFIIDSASGTVQQQFSAALTAIRGAALPCQYTLPTPAGGAVPDYGKLNAQYTSGSGAVIELPNVKSASRCGAGGGWFYDVDPASGTPTALILCPASCSAVSGDPGGRVDVVLGCQTITI